MKTKLLPAMKTVIYCIVLLLTISCSVGNKQVFYKEMFSAPKAELTEHGLLIKTENSKENSALSVYSIKARIDKENHEVRLKGYQALDKKYKNEFKIELERNILQKITEYKLIWVDPDGKEHEIEIKDKSNQ